MKKTITISFILFLLLGTFRDMVSLLSFRLNQNYISQNLCENREDPMSMCAGKCFFTKIMKKAHDKDEAPTAPAPIEDRKSMQFFISEFSIDENLGILFYKKNQLFFEKELIGTLLIFDVFHPPKR